MRYNNPSQQPYSGSVIGNSSDPTAATTAQFGAFWGELARRFKDNKKVIFGLMNEVSQTKLDTRLVLTLDKPHDMDTNLIFANNQAAITAIRNTSAKQLYEPTTGEPSIGTNSYAAFSPQAMPGQERDIGQKIGQEIHHRQPP
jgi:aryl-phospho-beta-D-glucosidase BglC (GH1 family)